jgi:hypothetical protein
LINWHLRQIEPPISAGTYQLLFTMKPEQLLCDCLVQVASVTATRVPVGYADAPPVASADVASATAANVRMVGQEDVPGQVRWRYMTIVEAPTHLLPDAYGNRMPHKHPPKWCYVVSTEMPTYSLHIHGALVCAP